MARSAELAETLKTRIALAEGAKEIKSLTDRIAEIQSAARAYRTQTERRIIERERPERSTDREMMARSSAPPQREITAALAQQGRVATDNASAGFRPNRTK